MNNAKSTPSIKKFYALSTKDFDEYFYGNLHYKGCFPNDKVNPKLLKKPGDFMIVNVDPSCLSGSHWFCLKKIVNGLELFDSWNLPQIFLGDYFINKMKKYKRITFMPFAIQHEDSVDVTCGWHCISFINSNLSLKNYAKLFYEDRAGGYPEIEKHNLQTMNSFLAGPVNTVENNQMNYYEAEKLNYPLQEQKEARENILNLPVENIEKIIDKMLKETAPLRTSKRKKKQTQFLINEMK